MSIILSDHKTGFTQYSYDMALVILDIDPLEVRRFKLCQKSAKQTLKSRHADIFRANQNQHNTRMKPEFLGRGATSIIGSVNPTVWLSRLGSMKSEL